jgi:putative FmdB family regulatory protein
MPIYQYRCQTCGRLTEIQTPIADRLATLACDCGGVARRRYTAPHVKPVMHQHWNHTIGAPVSSDQAFRAELARKSDEMAERLGMDVNYQPIDSDATSVGVDGAGLEATDRAAVESGRRDVKVIR